MADGTFPLTQRQLECARVIDELTTALGRSPLVVEIAYELDVGPSNVIRLLKLLEERGWLQPRAGNAVHAIRLAHRPPPLEEVDVEITAAGAAFLAEEARDAAAPDA